ncbi:CPBP family intramembrane glutamic endopeptidase [Mucilaginibacter sp. PAMB04274]|uniref:CPBP family intramembrane glutamic endopeptidase n=1 Tax=Mucilaginibacter sp. PAMB04274 TaxID=3138568 RepID=UPI0031F6B721
MKNILLSILKDFGILFGYTLIYILILGIGSYAFELVTRFDGRRLGTFLLDDVFLKASETIILLTFFFKRRTLRLNYSRILRFKTNKLLFANQGFGFAALLIFFITGLMMAFGAVHVYFNAAYSVAELGIYFILFILVGFNEEFLMRGIWVEYLRIRHSDFTAIVISSGVFAALHLFNPNVTALSFLNLLLAGVILAQLYLLTKNIWLATLFHLSWNFFQGPVLGFSVSGLSMHSIFTQPGKQADDIVNGGAFGLEGSVITTLVLLLFSFALYQKLKRRQVKPAIALQ